MNKSFKPVFFVIVAFVTTLSLLLLLAASSPLVVLNPQGLVAAQERQLILTATLLMLLVVIPVFLMTFGFAWHYRASNRKARYQPEWDHNSKLELTWWAFPSAIILILAVLTWKSSHQLDPYQPLLSNQPPLTIQVIALPWKWLFIYPEQHIASLNYLQFPEQTPIRFLITADAPMNSFWIPELGGQMYAMPGMSTELNLMADSNGNFRGLSANMSGKGFADMHFEAQARSQAEFTQWVSTVSQSGSPLSLPAYAQLAKPSLNQTSTFYAPPDPNLYNDVIMKYMMPGMNNLFN